MAGTVSSLDVRHDGTMDHGSAGLARTLRDLGLWRNLPSDEADAEQRRVAEGGYPFGLFGEPGETWFLVDSEEMAEGRAPEMLGAMAAALRAYGIDLIVETVSRPMRIEDGDYIISINGRNCLMWSPVDWAGYHSWVTATVRPLAVINDLLAGVRATERLFAHYPGGNEAVALLLDPRIVTAVEATGRFKDIPQRPTIPQSTRLPPDAPVIFL